MRIVVSTQRIVRTNHTASAIPPPTSGRPRTRATVGGKEGTWAILCP
jgi:hypothetical protein